MIPVLHLSCYRYTSEIILDHFLMLRWILDPESSIITRISLLDLPRRLVHQIVTSPLPDHHINRSITAIRPTTRKMCIILRSVMVVGSLFSIVTPYRLETLFVVTEETSIRSCSNGSLPMRWHVVNIIPPSYLMICRVIYEISQYPMIDTSEACRLNGLIWINSQFEHTCFTWATSTRESYVLGGPGFSLFNIWQ